MNNYEEKEPLKQPNDLNERTFKDWSLDNYYSINIGFVLFLLLIAVVKGMGSDGYNTDALYEDLGYFSIFLWVSFGLTLVFNYFNTNLRDIKWICILNLTLYLVNIILVLSYYAEDMDDVSMTLWFLYLPCNVLGILLSKMKLEDLKKK